MCSYSSQITLLVVVGLVYFTTTEAAPTFGDEYVHIKVHVPKPVRVAMPVKHWIKPKQKVIHHYHHRHRPRHSVKKLPHVLMKDYAKPNSLNYGYPELKQTATNNHVEYLHYVPDLGSEQPIETYVVQHEEKKPKKAVNTYAVVEEKRPKPAKSHTGYYNYHRPKKPSSQLGTMKESTTSRENNKYLPTVDTRKYRAPHVDNYQLPESPYNIPSLSPGYRAEQSLPTYEKAEYNHLHLTNPSLSYYRSPSSGTGVYPYEPITTYGTSKYEDSVAPGKLTSSSSYFKTQYNPEEGYRYKRPNSLLQKSPFADIGFSFESQVKYEPTEANVEQPKTEAPPSSTPRSRGSSREQIPTGQSSSNHKNSPEDVDSGQLPNGTLKEEAPGGNVIDWPIHPSSQEGQAPEGNAAAADTYIGLDSYSVGHVQGVGSGGYKYPLPYP